jgi:uncharacterized protein YndB with AHSA1/START domain
MAEGAELTWTWEMYGVSTTVRVREAERGRRIRYTWDAYDPAHPTTVQFELTPYRDDATYLRITETGFAGDGDTQVRRALDSTAGFTFLLSSLKAALEHDITLRVVLDAHPPDLPPPSP